MINFSNRASGLSIDSGGASTDIFLMTPDGRHHTQKILSTSDDYSRTVVEGAEAIAEQNLR
ncbi:MAG: hypothetical protein GY850_19400 [bacterium]|nr:hypothetical protein [bacterium]